MVFLVRATIYHGLARAITRDTTGSSNLDEDIAQRLAGDVGDATRGRWVADRQ
jgi:hypothetical protein